MPWFPAVFSMASRPPSIAVHDHGDVPRQPRQVQLLEQAHLFWCNRAERTRCGDLQRLGSGAVGHGVYAGFLANPLYAAKLTHVSAVTQRHGAVFSIRVAAASVAEKGPCR